MVCRPQLRGARRSRAGGHRRFAADAARTPWRKLLAEFERDRPGLPAGHGPQGQTRPGWGGSCATRQASSRRSSRKRTPREEQRRITEVNMSTYVFDGRDLLHALDRCGPTIASGSTTSPIAPASSSGRANGASPGRAQADRGPEHQHAWTSWPSVEQVMQPVAIAAIATMNDLKIFSGRANPELGAADLRVPGPAAGPDHDRQLSPTARSPARSTRTSAAATCSSCSRPARRSTTT